MTFYFIPITLHNFSCKFHLNDFAVTHLTFAHVQVHVLHVRSMPYTPQYLNE